MLGFWDRLLGLGLLLALVACNSQATAEPQTEAPVVTTEAAEATPSAAPSATTEPTIARQETPTVSASATSPPTLTATAAAPEQHYFDSPEYGIQAFMFWKPDIAQRDLQLVQELGFGWVKQGFAWRDIQPFAGAELDWWKPDKVVEQVENAGLKLLVRIDRQPFWSQEEEWPPLENAPPADLQTFGDFCGAMAERYRGRIAAYQVWNEPNLSREWGEQPPDPAAYTELLRVCYEAIKATDPQAIVISAGLAPTGTRDASAMPDTEFLQGMYDAGAGAYFDVLGVNAPGYKAPPAVAPEVAADPDAGYGGGRWFAFRHVEDMRAIMVANGDEAKQIAILEMGWILQQDLHPGYTWHGVTEAEQAAYLVEAYEYARENWHPWIGLMTTVYIADYHWTAEENEQWWWSIVLPDGTRRQAFDALKEMEK